MKRPERKGSEGNCRKFYVFPNRLSLPMVSGWNLMARRNRGFLCFFGDCSNLISSFSLLQRSFVGQLRESKTGETKYCSFNCLDRCENDSPVLAKAVFLDVIENKTKLL